MEWIASLLIFLIVLVILRLIYEVSRQQVRGNTPHQGWPEPTYSTPTTHPDRAVQHLQNRLLSMVGGNVETAERLISHTRSSFPGRSDRWVIERTIDDLVRDRR